ncbi:MAG: hypothetical protein Q8L65_05310 [Burkholderiales bacterium]|nr:hypothetical protein [Burkholderiales bacterium]
MVQSTIDKWCMHSVNKNNYQKIGNPIKRKHPDLIWIMVRLPASGIDNCRFFICKESQIQQKIIERYSAFMKKHSFRRLGGGTSNQAILNIRDIEKFEGNWNAIDAVIGIKRKQ